MSAFLGQEIESKKAFLPYYVTNLIYNMLKLYSVKAFKYIFVAVGCYVTFTSPFHDSANIIYSILYIWTTGDSWLSGQQRKYFYLKKG